MASTGTVYSFQAMRPGVGQVGLDQYRGKVLLIVNVASQCGFTPQYTGLEKLYEKFKDRGFEILGFPCNQFGAQEPGSDEEIQQFCSLNFGVQFPVFSKVDVNGAQAHPLFVFLKKEAPGLLGSEGIKWNFTKFLISKEGKVLERYAPQTTPAELEKVVERALSGTE